MSHNTEPIDTTRLRDLLKSIAVYATGGLKALEARGTGSDRKLLTQLKGGGSDR